jgi:superfamily II DNA or RNA helicase
MRKNRIYAYNTHYEIYDYKLGEYKDLERALTYHDFTAYSDYPKFMYDKENQTLFIPRGFDSYILEQWNGKPVTVVTNETEPVPINFTMKLSPKDDNQKKAIRFLSGEEEFKSMAMNPQKVLIMPPSAGKTYCTMAAIQKLHVRALIIMHTQTLKEQWIERIKEYTNMGGPNIVELTSSQQLHAYMKKKPSSNQKIFISTRSLLISYCDRYGVDGLSEVINRMGIGVKVFDEAHKEYARTLFIDYVTNVKWTFYLTATFQLSNYGENQVFQRAFNMVPKLQIKRDDSARHIVYLAVIFNSHPNPMEEIRITGKKRGFDRFAYIDYELEKGILEREVRYMIDFFLNKKNMTGKTLILSSKKSTCNYFSDIAKDETDNKYRTCAFYTGNKVDNYKGYDIISATAQMLGTGEDIPGLRFMLNTEPCASLPNTDQFSGRLRPFEGGTKDTFYVEFIDIGFEKVYQWYRRREKLLRTKVKTVHELKHIT